MMITPALHITSGQQEAPAPPTSNHQGLLETNALQIILDLCIPEKELAKTRSQISFI
jgi:hypothetical protein